MFSHSVPLSLLPALLVLLLGCATGGSTTYVEGGLSPRHFDFHNVVSKRGKRAGGWRAACLEAGIERANTGELFYCKFGVEMPVANGAQGEISIETAQSISASCANQAAKTTLATVTPTSPIGIACEDFKTLYDLILRSVIAGSMVTKVCYPGVPPVRLTPPVTPPVTP
jgi:hypothetical protein